MGWPSPALSGENAVLAVREKGVDLLHFKRSGFNNDNFKILMRCPIVLDREPIIEDEEEDMEMIEEDDD